MKDDGPDVFKQEKDLLPNPIKKRKLNNVSVLPRIPSSNARQSTKFKIAIELLDNFRANHGGKLPSLRAIMKMLKVGCPKEKLVQNMTVRQQKKNVNDIKIIYNNDSNN